MYRNCLQLEVGFVMKYVLVVVYDLKEFGFCAEGFLTVVLSYLF